MFAWRLVAHKLPRFLRVWKTADGVEVRAPDKGSVGGRWRRPEIQFAELRKNELVNEIATGRGREDFRGNGMRVRCGDAGDNHLRGEPRGDRPLARADSRHLPLLVHGCTDSSADVNFAQRVTSRFVPSL